MSLVQVVLLCGAGLAAGFIAGLVGVGGGVIFTPVLFAVYGVLNVPSGVRTPLTVGTGLFCTGLAAGASAVHHYTRGAVALRMAGSVGLASAGAVAVVSGFVVTRPWFDEVVFQLLFATVLLVVVARMLRTPRQIEETESDKTGTGWATWVGTGTVAGAVASAAGVGGGVVLVPAYSRILRLPVHRAVGTSSATIVVISVLSSVAYAVLGGGIAGRPTMAIGYVDVATGLVLALPAVLGGRMGAAVAHRLERTWLRWSFALLAVVVAGRLVWGAFT